MAVPLPRSRMDSRTTCSTFSHMNFGMLDISMPARWWNSVRTNPGHSACTWTPVPARPPDSPSENEMTYALDAEYVDPRPDRMPATLATLTTVPFAAATI